MRAIEWDAGRIVILDQTRLPDHEVHRTLTNAKEVAEAIVSLAVRGAPSLGIVAAMGVAQGGFRSRSSVPEGVLRDAEKAAKAIRDTRPTAANLGRAIDRVLEAATRAAAQAEPADEIVQVMVDEALAVQEEEERASMEMARRAQRFFKRKRGSVLTHCNTGSLATAGYGTALGAIRLAFEKGKEPTVLYTETRPLLQGARLTGWELERLSIPHTLVADAAAPGLIARGEVSLVVVGADRIAANGDVANKVGTYPLALAADDAGVPFVVVAPTSTVDLGVADGSGIPIEERSAEEVTGVLGVVRTSPRGTDARNPAFDVTPARLITAIVTEAGVAEPPFGKSLAKLMDRSRRKSAS
jgi:methylthioribose-1-phosphate isomerase